MRTLEVPAEVQTPSAISNGVTELAASAPSLDVLTAADTALSTSHVESMAVVQLAMASLHVVEDDAEKNLSVEEKSVKENAAEENPVAAGDDVTDDRAVDDVTDDREVDGEGLLTGSPLLI